ncbi:MAG TPA: hypothetical protein VK846_02180, partial [Candidatus Limnocylindria bacterium]|nr:hypothetical protein [Candidatus Limnocylindria bacterium]
PTHKALAMNLRAAATMLVPGADFRAGLSFCPDVFQRVAAAFSRPFMGGIIRRLGTARKLIALNKRRAGFCLPALSP